MQQQQVIGSKGYPVDPVRSEAAKQGWETRREKGMSPRGSSSYRGSSPSRNYANSYANSYANGKGNYANYANYANGKSKYAKNYNMGYGNNAGNYANKYAYGDYGNYGNYGNYAGNYANSSRGQSPRKTAWYGDSQGHSAAAKKGWENRQANGTA